MMKSSNKSAIMGHVIGCLHYTNRPTELKEIYTWISENANLDREDELPSKLARKKGHGYGRRIKDSTRRVLSEMVKCGLVQKVSKATYEANKILTINRLDGK